VFSAGMGPWNFSWHLIRQLAQATTACSYAQIPLYSMCRDDPLTLHRCFLLDNNRTAP
jgi:hypothetical protein